jgi:hypothetical protein
MRPFGLPTVPQVTGSSSDRTHWVVFGLGRASYFRDCKANICTAFKIATWLICDSIERDWSHGKADCDPAAPEEEHRPRAERHALNAKLPSMALLHGPALNEW